MLTLTPGQWQALREDDIERFVAAVADQLIAGPSDDQALLRAVCTTLNS